MNIFLNDDETEEVPAVPNTEDRGLTISPREEDKGKREERDDVIKEIIANDVIQIGPKASAEIHGVSISTAKNYANGKSLSEEAKTRILDAKHDIKNIAITKLMQTLNLIDPTDVEKQKDLIPIMNGLSQVLDRIEGEQSKSGDRAVHLHMHMPTMKRESDYGEVINVTKG